MAEEISPTTVVSAPPVKPFKARLLQAIGAADFAGLKTLLTAGEDADDNLLRQGLQRAAEVGNVENVELLLAHGAKQDVPGNVTLTPLFRALDRNRLDVVKFLVRNGSSADSIDRNGTPAILLAAWCGHDKILTFLLQQGADVNATNTDQQTVLHYLAADKTKKPRWNWRILSIILETGIDLELHDKDGRTALHWAAAEGKWQMVDALLSRTSRKPADVRATTRRSKNALHLAAEWDKRVTTNIKMKRETDEAKKKKAEAELADEAEAVRVRFYNTVEVLVEKGADIHGTSDGFWTPLHNAAEQGHPDIIDLLLRKGADVNAKTSSGMTPLHWAAEMGRHGSVKRLLEESTAVKNPKDAFDATPLTRAAQHMLEKDAKSGYADIVRDLRPFILGGALSDDAKRACAAFEGAVVDFHSDEKRAPLVDKRSVHELLYALDNKDSTGQTFATTTRIQDIKPQFAFRWIHLPANNIAWAEALITKRFLEGGATDLTRFKNLLSVFSRRQHRGPKVHSRFMQPVCAPIGKGHHQGPSSAHPASALTLMAPPPLPSSRRSSPSKGSDRRNSLPGKERAQRSEHNAVLFLPYLHWETDTHRTKMNETIIAVQAARRDRRDNKTIMYQLPEAHSKDEFLIRAYLNSSTDLHIRRTLDQFYHHSITTEKRDRDQVVYRYCKHTKKELKIFMVDQLWCWILGNDLIVTCFPQRWGQPKRDPLSLFDGLIEDINSKTKPPIRNVHDLAAAITERCTGAFDRHQWELQDYHFLEMFELSIGMLTRRETALFERFQRDSAASAHWLRSHDKARRVFRPNAQKLLEHRDAEDVENDEDDWLNQTSQQEEEIDSRSPRFVDRLLNISQEATLLVECKDIRDELGILRKILEDQKSVLESFKSVCRAAGDTEGRGVEMNNKIFQQQRVIDVQLKDVARMDKQAGTIYDNLGHVLDLKQKHASSLEARFARDQAEDTARQGHTIMVFTIVTIIFLPMSLMAAFFTINIQEFPHDSSNGGNGLHLGYVVKYVLGIGFAISVPLVIIAFTLDDIRSLFESTKRKMRQGREKASHNTPHPHIHTSHSEHHLTEKSLKDVRLSSESYAYPSPRRVWTNHSERSKRSHDPENG